MSKSRNVLVHGTKDIRFETAGLIYNSEIHLNFSADSNLIACCGRK